MSNNITIELCTEDRARLDKLTAALEALQPMTIHWSPTRIEQPDPDRLTIDDVQEALAETLAKATDPAEAPKKAVEEAETSTQTTTPPEEEKPTDKETATAPNEPPVTREELKAKVIKLCAKGLKEQTRDIVRAYAQTVTDVPEDKLTECYKKLVALEA